MRSLGYNVPLHLVIAFTVSGFFAGTAGALYAIFNNFVSPSTVALAQSVAGLLMAIVGGVGTLFGSFVGAFRNHRARAGGQLLHRTLADGARRHVRPDHDLRPRGGRRKSKGAIVPERRTEGCTMMDRRQFLKTTAGVTAVSTVGAPAIVKAQGSGPIKNRPACAAHRRGRLRRQEMVEGFSCSGAARRGSPAARSRSSPRTTPPTPTRPCRRRAGSSSRPTCTS